MKKRLKWTLVLLPVIVGLLAVAGVMTASAAYDPTDADVEAAVRLTRGSGQLSNTAGEVREASNITVAIQISLTQDITDVAYLAGAEVHLRFDTGAISEVVDYDANPENGVQIEPSSDLFDGTVHTGQNEASNTNGTIDYAVTQEAGSGTFYTDTSGLKTLAIVTFKGKSVTSDQTSGITVTTESLLSNKEGVTITVDYRDENETINNFADSTVSGTITMQGRSGTNVDNAWVAVSASEGSTKFDNDTDVTTNGSYSFDLPSSSLDLIGSYTIEAGRDGYLSAEDTAMTLGSGTAMTFEGELKGGDVVPNNDIDISDITFIASRFGNTGLTVDWPSRNGDVTGDGKVNILDLSIAAANWDVVAPETWTAS